MNPADYRVRRATVDDLGALRPMWESMRLPVADLEKRLTEFQVVVASEGPLVGALGIQIAGQHALLHSEAYTDFAHADRVRPLLWQRIETIAANHGVFRVWTRERVPFWTRLGFQSARDEVLANLPEAWDHSAGDWLTLQLKDEEAIRSVEKEFALFKESEKRQTEQVFGRAKTLRTVICVVGFGLGAIFIGLAIYLFVRRFLPSLHDR